MVWLHKPSWSHLHAPCRRAAWHSAPAVASASGRRRASPWAGAGCAAARGSAKRSHGKREAGCRARSLGSWGVDPRATVEASASGRSIAWNGSPAENRWGQDGMEEFWVKFLEFFNKMEMHLSSHLMTDDCNPPVHHQFPNPSNTAIFPCLLPDLDLPQLAPLRLFHRHGICHPSLGALTDVQKALGWGQRQAGPGHFGGAWRKSLRSGDEAGILGGLQAAERKISGALLPVEVTLIRIFFLSQTG